MSLKALVKVDSKGRITIPLYIREALNIGPDSYVELEVIKEKGVILIRGAATPGETAVDFDIVLNDLKGLQDVISVIISSGSELKFMKCVKENGRHKCSITVLTLDLRSAEELKEEFIKRGLKVLSMKPVIRKAM